MAVTKRARCADRRNGGTDVEDCARIEPCPHCTDPACNYQAGRESGIQDGMEYGEKCGRYNAEEKSRGAQEERKFVHAVADLMPFAMRASVEYVSVAPLGEASLRELSRRQAAGDLAGDIDVFSWAGAPA